MEMLKILMTLINESKTTLITFALIFISVFGFYYRRNIYIIIKTFPRDLKLILLGIKLIISYLIIVVYRKDNVISAFQRNVKKQPDKPIFYFQDTVWTAIELESYSNKIARVFQNQGYKKGDVVALMSYNRPEYIGIWLGLGKIGVITALINTNLKSQSLAHCVNVAKCKGFIFTSDFAEEVNEIRDSLSPSMQFIVYDSSNFPNPALNLNVLLKTTSDEAVVPHERITIHDRVLYIYTSGTTGLPKAAIMTHSRLLYLGGGIFLFNSGDIIYDPLPLYHTSGGIIGIMPALMGRVSVVIRTKFSASCYFADCIKYKCTIGQYIGEMCRYMLAVPPSAHDTKHSLRFIIGNGVKADVWKLFVERFKIPAMIELYGSTEGNSNIINIDNTIGSVGFKPSFIPLCLYPIILVKYDESKDEIIRDKNGFCIRCKTGEPGMCIGMIKKDFFRKFEGYVDKNETGKKIIRNVFKKDDSAFVSGDILYMDEFGYIYFKDRTGDTFRWKGENVSTGEVEMVVQQLINFKDCTVYGVKVGNLEGRAGMVAIADPNEEVNLETLAKGLDKNLPAYARPLFLRILPEIKFTGTYKIVKGDLREEGCNLHVIKDKLYFKDPIKGFVPLTETLYNAIINGIVKI